jgi:hypothetical protein
VHTVCTRCAHAAYKHSHPKVTPTRTRTVTDPDDSPTTRNAMNLHQNRTHSSMHTNVRTTTESKAVRHPQQQVAELTDVAQGDISRTYPEFGAIASRRPWPAIRLLCFSLHVNCSLTQLCTVPFVDIAPPCIGQEPPSNPARFTLRRIASRAFRS